ncbi:MAG: hypothetical protein ABSA59_16480 [Terriglobia bacterium]
MKSVYLIDLAKKKIDELSPRSARDLKVKEKTIEDLMARNPGLVFTQPDAVLVIGQEVAGEPMADLLAVDSQGALIVIEAKRGSSDRNTVGQLLDYAAKLSTWGYDDFNKSWQRNPESKDRDLSDAFKMFADNPTFPKEDFLRDRRYFILASTGDEDMKRIIEWLKKYKAPIDFVPFQFYSQGKQRFLEIDKIDVDLEPPVASHNWIFNTNEKYAPGSYRKMLKDGVIALANYTNTEEKLNRPIQGDRIFAYLNGKGIIAVGRMGGELAYPSRAIFKEEEDEWNRKVEWKVRVDADKGLRAAEAREWGYNLPTLAVLGKMANAKVAEKIAKELEKRV